MNAYIAVGMASIAGPELDRRIAEYENGTLAFNKDDMLRDLKAATNLASMLSLELEKKIVG